MTLPKNEDKNRKNTRLVISVFIILTLIATVLSYLSWRHDYLAERGRATLNAQFVSDRIQQDFMKAILITDSLESAVISTDGDVRNFDGISQNLMRDYISSIQLAPGGRVSYIYPHSGNEAGMIDLFADEDRGKVVRYAMDHNTVTMQGTFDLKQGGKGIAVRNPIFLENADGTRVFWGFGIVIMKIPEVYENSLHTLDTFGFDYTLSATEIPLERDMKVVATSLNDGEELKNPETETFELGGCTWTIAVSPKIVTGSYRFTRMVIGLFSIVLLFTFMTYLLAQLQTVHKQLEKKLEEETYAGEHDVLTGLFNRRMYERMLADINTGTRERVCIVNMDVNELKRTNDCFGHQEGDELIKAAAESITGAFGQMGTCFRTGGDEFAVIILDREVREEELICHLMEYANLRRGNLKEGLAISVGIAISTKDHPLSVEEMLEKADDAMYADKRLYYSKRGNDRRKSLDHITKSQLANRISDLKEIFDMVRVLDVEQNRAIRYGADGEENFDDLYCYHIWGRDRECSNCVSSQTMQDHRKHSKIEVSDEQTYFITSHYVSVDGRPMILEAISKLEDSEILWMEQKEKGEGV